MSETPYGSQPFPTGPEEPTGPPAPMEQPQSIRLAVIGMYVGAALSALGILSTFFTMDQVRETAEETAADVGIGVDAMVAASVASATLFGLVAVGLWIWMAIMNGRGRSWARIVATVLGGVNILFTLLSFVGGAATAFAAAVNAVTLLLAIAILVLLWLPTSSAYFRARSQRFSG